MRKTPSSGRTASLRGAYFAILSTCLGSAAFAQQPPPRLPSAAEPGKELRQPQQLQIVPDGGAIAVPEAPAVQPPVGSEKISFKLTRVTVEGATLLSQQEIERYYAGRIGQTVTVADMFGVAAAIENEYRNRGYVITRALLPEQKIQSGEVRIVVVEGFISDITVADEVGSARAQIEALLAPLRNVRPISVAAVERRLLLANDLPGIHVRGTLTPSTAQRGAATLVIAADRDPFDASVLLDNRNSPYTGSNQAIVRGTLNSFTSQAATVSLQAKTAFPYRREHMFQGSYNQSIGGDGWTAGVSALTAKSHPGKNLTPLEVFRADE